MKTEVIQKILDMLPDGKKKEELVTKYMMLLKKRQQSDRGEGLYDEYALKPKGHILIEEIDDQGNPVGVLADQPNLVVNGAEEIILRSLSGDPKRILYKNRIPKNGESALYHTPITSDLTGVVNEEDVLMHPANELWKEVDDSEFEIEYSYYPITMYVTEESSLEPGMRAFKIYDKANAPASAAPITSEIYSTFTNMFIGLGDGLNRNVPLDDNRLSYLDGSDIPEGDASYTGTWLTDANGNRETTTIGDKITFTGKISNIEIKYNKQNIGGQIGIYVNGVLDQTIETFDSTVATGEVIEDSTLIADLDVETETTIELVYEGNAVSPGPADNGTPEISISAIRTDDFVVSDNNLIHEFENYTLNFDTPKIYNTTASEPYYVQLEHYPVDPNSIVVNYNGEMTKVSDLSNLTNGSYYVEANTGRIYFNQALTGLLISYSATGEILEDEMVSNLTSTATTFSKVDGDFVESPDGSRTTFTINNAYAINNVVDVKVNGSSVIEGTDYSVSDNQVIFTTAPAGTDTLTVDFNYTVDIIEFTTQYAMDDPSSVIVQDQNGNALTYASDIASMTEGTYTSSDSNHLSVFLYNASGEPITELYVIYYSSEKPGVPTDYRRQVVLKPKDVNEYPWFALDKGQIQFVAEFKEEIPNHNVTIREMGLFDGPRADDHIRGYDGYHVKAFSLVRVGETKKESSTGIRVTWTITLLDENGDPFKGGNAVN